MYTTNKYINLDIIYGIMVLLIFSYTVLVKVGRRVSLSKFDQISMNKIY